MEPRPVITYFGDVEILGTVLQKKLQTRLMQFQVQSLPRDEGNSSAFSALCHGVKFVPFVEKIKAGLPYFQRPALHIFLSGCTDSDRYRSHDRPLIKQWLDKIAKLESGCGHHPPPLTLIVYCVTAEVRAKRQHLLSHLGSSVEERLRTDYKAAVDDIIVFKLASSEESRLIESFQSLVSKLNSMALTKFSRDIEAEKEAIASLRGVRSDPEHFYKDIFLRKLHLAVACEMTVRNEEALSLYSEATNNLEDALTMFADSASPPGWLESIRKAPCTTWDYPMLAWTRPSWRYLQGIQECSSPLLHTRTFLLVRVAHLYFLLERAWSVSQLVINTLHCMAREIKMLKLTFPAGAFDCWAYMTCNEAILAFMARISPDSLESATSSLLLVRAQLWHYALQKLHDIGILCGLMPSSNKLNHDKVLIQHISSGITPVPQELIDTSMIGVEDQGKKLQSMLGDRQTFQTEFLMLGEMVIGAFKHAGRRRMAFRVGTMIAQFHRDLGLMVEAEELLSDICKFYSEDHWSELSTKAYSLLADCQMKLKLEDKYVGTLLLLSSFPPYPAASHDPAQWMDKLSRIAQRSPYQKLLNWEPLLELVRVQPLKHEGYSTGDKVQLEVVLKLHGPKELKSVIVTAQTRLAGTLVTTAGHTPHHAPPPTTSVHSLQNMEDLDLELNSMHLPHSRPIGGSKFRSTSQLVTTHLPHSVIAEMEAGGSLGEEGGGKGREPVLVASQVSLKPGENRVTLEGKGEVAGEFVPYKISIKHGCLDFVHTLSPGTASKHVLKIEDPQVNVDIALTPDQGVFLSGVAQTCILSFMTGRGTTIPEGATVRMVTSSDVTLEFPHPPSQLTVHSEGGMSLNQFTLPAVGPEASHDYHVTMRVAAVKHVRTTLAEAQDTAEQLTAWKHEVEVYCDWLKPCYMATLPLTVHEPLTLSCLEHSAAGGQSSFLQLQLQNTSPLPLVIRTPSLTTHLSLEKLHGNLPQVFFPLENFSFLWKAEPGPPVIQDKSAGSFEVEFSLLPMTFDWNRDSLPKDSTFHTTKFPLFLSNMQTVFEVEASVEPGRDQASLVVHKPALLLYTIKNIMPHPPQETRFGATPPSSAATTPGDEATPTNITYRLGYEVCADKKVWSLKDRGQGVMDIPEPQTSVRVCVGVVPCDSGSLDVPELRLSWSVAQGRGLTTPPTSQGKGCVLTGAQVYNISYGQTVNVHQNLIPNTNR